MNSSMNKVTTWCLTRFKAYQKHNAISDILRGCILLLSMAPFQFSYGSELPPFPNANLRLTADEDRQNHPVITSRMKRVNGVVTSDGALWLDGHLKRALYLLPPGHSSSQGYDFYVNQLGDQGVETLFQCQSFSCGASNFWANEIFDIPILYGQDKEQAFYIGKNQGRYYSIYSVRRGNGRVYTLVDVFRPSGSDLEHTNEHKKPNEAKKVLVHLDKGGVTSSAELKALIAEMNRNSGVNALLVIHSPRPDTLTELDNWLQQMGVLKNSIKKHLNDQGINDARLRFNVSVGTFGDSVRNVNIPSFWLEIMLVN